MYTINYDPAALLIYFFCLIYSLGARRKQYIPPKGFRSRMLNQHFVFMLILQVSIVAAAASAAVTYLTDRPASATYGLMFWLNEVFFLAHTMLAAFLTLYFMNVNGSALGRRRAFYLGFAIPFLCGEAVILTNHLTKLVFYLDQDLIYHRGPVMPLLYLLSLSYIATGFFYFFRYRRAISKAESIVIVCIVGLAVVGVVVQALRPDLLVELFF